MKAGWKTTEFWLTGLASTLGWLMASGAFEETSFAYKITGAVVAGLASLGYAAGRSLIKSRQNVSLTR